MGVVYQAAVELDDVDGELSQAGQVGGPATEPVESKSDTDALADG